MRFILFLLVIFIALPGAEPAAARSLGQSFTGDVVHRDAPYAFVLSCCRASGLELSLVRHDAPITAEQNAKIGRLLARHSWHCTTRDRAPDPITGRYGVWCSREDGTLLARLLIEAGLARENCAQSGGQFGTCRD